MISSLLLLGIGVTNAYYTWKIFQHVLAKEEGPTNLKIHPWEIQEPLAKAITQIAQKACRNGEAHDRAWPPLKELKYREDWREVGDRYAKEFVQQLYGRDAEKPR